MGRKINDHIKRFDHYAIYVEDLEASIHFYGTIMGFPSMVRPPFDFPGAWFDMGEGQELHLIAGKGAPASGNRLLHFAFEVDNFDAVIEICNEYGLFYEAPKRRPDGPYQLFVRDNSGYYLEFTHKVFY